jgi:hypothetical protein
MHRPEAVVGAAHLAAEQRVRAVRRGRGDLEGSRAQDRGGEFPGIGVGGEVARAHDGYPVRTVRICERRELLIRLQLKLLIRLDHEVAGPAARGDEAVGDFLSFAREDMPEHRAGMRWAQGETAGRIHQACDEHQRSPHACLPAISHTFTSDPAARKHRMRSRQLEAAAWARIDAR